MRRAWGIAIAVGLALAATGAQAQPYPNRSIKIVVPATPGGAIDVIARMVGDKLSASMGQSVVIENKPGASNNALEAEDVRARLGANGIDIQGGTPERFADYIKAEVAKWGKVTKDAGIQPE